MANFSGKFLKVWKVKENNGYIKLDLGDSQKNKDGSYDNWTWFDCLLLGEAGKKTFYEQDTIEITSGMIYQEKYNEKWYTRVKIFHAHVVDKEGNRSDNEATSPAPKKEYGKFVPGGGSQFKPAAAPFKDDDIPF